jgi:pilus assembly protein CpaF
VISPTQANRSVFAIVISEKGGAERREVFERPEISVGRVQGNDLMLPKGNVSKRHARLIFRDGRFIVTDLNSTNGTYVNRRRISQATIVREGDRIYVGDFVLRIELPEGALEASSVADQTGSGPVLARQSAVDAQQLASVPAAELEESSNTSYPKVPGPPRVPTAARHPAATVEPPAADALSSANMRAASIVDASQPEIVAPPSEASAEGTARRQSFAQLVQRVAGGVDPRALDGEVSDLIRTQLERAASEHAAAMQTEGALAPGLEPERAARAAVAELVGLGPLEPLLADPAVAEIALPRFDSITITRGGAVESAEPVFSSELSLRRALGRLCARSGAALAESEIWVERRLSGGARLRAVIGPLAETGALAVIEKPRRVSVTLEDLVRQGTISRAMATFLGACVSARTNILVVGPRGGGTAHVVSALASVGGEHRVVALQDLDDVAVPGLVARVALPTEPASVGHVMRVASRVPEARLVVDASRADVAAAVLDAAGEGTSGIIAALNAQSVRRAFGRIAADLVAGHSGMSVSAARELVAAGFDVAIEVTRLRDGRWRVVRIAELAGASAEEVQVADIFTFSVERTAAGGSVEGSFNASGSVPRIADDLAARGYPLDGSIFTRPPSR